MTCVFVDKVRAKYVNPTARNIIINCIQKHEDAHVPDVVPCPNECPDLRWGTYREETSGEKSECKATLVQLACLRDSFWLCPDDECKNEVDSDYQSMMRHASTQCGKVGIPIEGLPGSLKP